MIRIASMCSAAAIAAAAFALATPAQALSMKECGAKYQDAKKANKDVKWQDFRKSECGDDDVSAADAAKEVKEEAPPAKPASTAAKTTAEKPSVAPPKTAGSGSVSFPTEVSAKYASETPGKARMHTCLDQYNVNKGANGGVAPMKWIEKGGGYYSQCNTKLKT